MSIAVFMLYFFELTAAASAVSLVFVRNVFYGALLMVICLLSIAGLYVLMFAEFMAVTQVLVYAGGILVIIIFGVMLTTKISGKPLVVEHSRLLGGIVCGIGVFGLLMYAFTSVIFESGIFSDGLSDQGIRNTGIAIMSEYVVPFEAAGILLLIALLGSAVIASGAKSKQQ